MSAPTPARRGCNRTGPSATGSKNPFLGAAPRPPLKGGRWGLGARKAKRGNPGERGPDLSVEVESLEGKSLRLEEENSLLNLNLLELNRTLSGQSRKIESLEKEKSKNFL